MTALPPGLKLYRSTDVFGVQNVQRLSLSRVITPDPGV